MVAYALAQGKPERMFGRHIGTPALATLGGYDCRPGKEGMPWATFLLAAAGMGGTNGQDGMSFCDSITWGSCKNHVWEHLENEMPLRIWDHAALIDSAGPGKYRGGLGAYYVVEALCDCVLTMSASRIYTRSKGVMGGGDVGGIFGAFVKREASGKIPRPKNGVIPGRYLDPIFGLFDDKNRPNMLHGSLERAKFKHANFSNLPVSAGDVLLIVQLGGSGWGNPLERNLVLVEKDVLKGLVSIEGAFENYGVVIDPLTCKADKAATAKRRQELEQKRAKGEWEPVNQQWSWPE